MAHPKIRSVTELVPSSRLNQPRINALLPVSRMKPGIDPPADMNLENIDQSG
jgi:hypothetical protein